MGLRDSEPQQFCIGVATDMTYSEILQTISEINLNETLMQQNYSISGTKISE